MRNPTKPIKPLDERIKTREEISKIVKSIMETDESGYPEKKKNKKTL